MKYKYVLIVGAMILFVIWIIALIVTKKTKHPFTKGEKVLNVIAKIILCINTIILFPILLGFAIDLGIIYFVGSLINPNFANKLKNWLRD